MKKMLILGLIGLIASTRGLLAEIILNNETFTSSTNTGNEVVYIGSDADGIVKVGNGATWTAENNVFIGRTVNKTACLNVLGGGCLSMPDHALLVGGTANTTGIVTNNGTIEVDYLSVAPSSQNDSRSSGAGTAFKLGRFDNYGALTVKTKFLIGLCSSSGSAISGIFHNHQGSSLTVNGGDSLIGERSPARLINEGTIVFNNPNNKLIVGRKLAGTSDGVLDLRGSSVFTPCNEVIIGAATQSGSVGYGRLEMKDDSVFGQKHATLKIGNSYNANSRIVLENNARLSVSNLLICNSKYVDGKVTLKDNSRIEHVGTLNIAIGEFSTGCVELVNHTMTSYHTNIHISAGDKSVGIFRVGGNTAYTANKEILFGIKDSSTARLEVADVATLSFADSYEVKGVTNTATAIVAVKDEANLVAMKDLIITAVSGKGLTRLEADDSSHIVVSNNLLVGESSQTSGEVSLAGNSTLEILGSLWIGSSFERKYKDVIGKLSMSGTSLLSCTNIYVGFSAAANGSRQSGLSGILEVGEGAVITNATMMIGTADSTKTTHGTLKMRGGEVVFSAIKTKPLEIGTGGTGAGGDIRGWGVLRYENFSDASANLYGQIIADGEGVERTLDCGRIGVMSWNGGTPNTCGTNGYFAVNKGMLKMPRSAPRLKTHDSVGDYPVDRNRYVNTFIYTLDAATKAKEGAYMFSRLYASDREDIPQGLPSENGSVVSSVFRIGYFNKNATPDKEDSDAELTGLSEPFKTIDLRFRYDPAVKNVNGVHRIRVYRCIDSVNGGWQRIGSIAADSSSAIINANTVTPSSELWNVGWFAIVAEPKKCTAIIVR